MIEHSWTNVFVIANAAQFGFGLVITGLSYSAYRSSGGTASFRNSTLGFLCITIGGVLAPVYELGIRGDYNITSLELLQLQVLEGTVIAIGLAFLLLSVLTFTDGMSDRTPAGIDVCRRGEWQDVDR